MKITNVSAMASVAMPVERAPYPTDGAGTRICWNGRRGKITPKRPSPLNEYVLLRIDTDEGVFGIGEAPVDVGFFGDTVEHVRIVIDDYFGPLLIGLDPFDRERIADILSHRGNTCATSGLDLALHDLMGKALDVPVSSLLGGRCRERIPVALEIAGGSPEGMAASCVTFMDQGVRAFKAKVGGDPVADAERVCAIREAVGPDVLLRADANQGFCVKEAIRFCRLAEKHDVGLEMLEQPVAAWDLQGMAQVRRSVDTMIAADESCFSIHDAMQIIRHEAADMLCVKLPKAGGLYAAKKVATLGESAGLKCVLGTSFGLGVEIAAKLHFAASTVALEATAEFTELGLHGNLLLPPYGDALALPLEDGCMPVPNGPGLGVELDDGVLKQFTL